MNTRITVSNVLQGNAALTTLLRDFWEILSNSFLAVSSSIGGAISLFPAFPALLEPFDFWARLTILPYSSAALEKIKESSQEVYKSEEYLARVKQSKELGIGLDDKTLANITAEEYGNIVNLAQKSNGSSNAGNTALLEQDTLRFYILLDLTL
jgi:hypothetical protein